MISIEFLRQFRVGGYSLFDFATAFLGIYIFSLLFSKLFRKLRLDIPKKSWMLLTLPIGIAAHLIVGRITPMTKNFLDIHGHYVLKILIISLLLLGIRGIKIIDKKNAQSRKK
jgi:hypothetical protein